MAIGSNSAAYCMKKRKVIYVCEVERDRRDIEEEVELGWKERMPDVAHWSDVAWLVWKDSAGPEAGKLRQIIRATITEKEANDVLEMVGRRKQGQQDPGRVWEPPQEVGALTVNSSEPGFAALLKTAHGRGVLFLVRQHREELGGRDIKSITIFSSYNQALRNNKWNMLFTLEAPQGMRETISTSSKPKKVAGQTKRASTPPITRSAGKKRELGQR